MSVKETVGSLIEFLSKRGWSNKELWSLVHNNDVDIMQLAAVYEIVKVEDVYLHSKGQSNIKDVRESTNKIIQKSARVTKQQIKDQTLRFAKTIHDMRTYIHNRSLLYLSEFSAFGGNTGVRLY
jgi:hypothetical protein